jgi:hypothetical protein
MSYSVHGVWPVPSSSTIMSCVLFSTCILVRPFQLDHHVLCPIQWMEAGQPVSSCSTIMSYVLFSGWSLASQSLHARPSCPMSCSVHGVWPARPFSWTIMSYVLFSAWSLASQFPSCSTIMSYALCPAHCRAWKHWGTKGTLLTKMSTRWRRGVSFGVIYEEANGNGRCFIQPAGPNSRRPPEGHQLSHWLVQRI